MSLDTRWRSSTQSLCPWRGFRVFPSERFAPFSTWQIDPFWFAVQNRSRRHIFSVIITVQKLIGVHRLLRLPRLVPSPLVPSLAWAQRRWRTSTACWQQQRCWATSTRSFLPLSASLLACFARSLAWLSCSPLESSECISLTPPRLQRSISRCLPPA